MNVHVGLVALLLTLASVSLETSAQTAAVGEVTVDRLNVRGQATVFSEVVTQLDKGQTVTVLEEVSDPQPVEGEPSKWFRIRLPAGAKAWVNALYVDPVSQEVTANLLHVRSGPGENYSILDRLERGTRVNVLEREGDWLRIEPSQRASAFVAANYVNLEKSLESRPFPQYEVVPIPLDTQSPEESSPSPVVPPQSSGLNRAVESSNRPMPEYESAPPKEENTQNSAIPPVVPAPVTHRNTAVSSSPQRSPMATKVSPPPVVRSTPPSESAVIPPTTTTTQVVGTAPRTTGSEPGVINFPKNPYVIPGPTTVTPVQETKPTYRVYPIPNTLEGPLPESDVVEGRRIVPREGIVKFSKQLLGPSRYVLVSLWDDRVMNYLRTDGTELNIGQFRGRHVQILGEELLDPKYPEVPILKIERFHLVP